MNIADKYLAIIQKFLPSPFSIAIVLSLLTGFIALIINILDSASIFDSAIKVLDAWYLGLWNQALLAFTIQMMLMLVLGHVLALSTTFEKLIHLLLIKVDSSGKAVITVAFCSMLIAYLNWGLGLIFGAILARKTAEIASKRGFAINYPLVGAAAYTGLMVWHGGLSGSAPLTVATEGHSLIQQMGIIPVSETIFSRMNLMVCFALLLLIPLCFWLIDRSSKHKKIPSIPIKETFQNPSKTHISGAERIDYWPLGGSFLGLIIIAYMLYRFIFLHAGIDLNSINLCLLGLGLTAHGSFAQFLHKIELAIGDVSGILVQFPLYFGIMGIMQSSGLVVELSDFFVSISTQQLLPVYSFISAAIVNIFIPSGGGQWQIQGPILIQSAQQLSVPMPKMVMAMAYGDQLTNMLQPFWALPLLSITSLKAKDILPYSMIAMIIGGLVFLCALLMF